MELNTFQFCPRCHVRVPLPDFMKNSNIQGKIQIGCSNCKKGKIVINPINIKKEEVING